MPEYFLALLHKFKLKFYMILYIQSNTNVMQNSVDNNDLNQNLALGKKECIK